MHEYDNQMTGLVPTMNGWMNGVLGHFYALSRLNWAGDNLGGTNERNSISSIVVLMRK